MAVYETVYTLSVSVQNHAYSSFVLMPNSGGNKPDELIVLQVRRLLHAELEQRQPALDLNISHSEMRNQYISLVGFPGVCACSLCVFEIDAASCS